MTILVELVKNEQSYVGFGNTKVAKQVLLKVLSDWSNYFKALRSYGVNSAKFLGKPKMPGYKNKLAQVTFYGETIRMKPRKKGIIQPTNDLFQIKSDKPFKQVVITPKAKGFVIDVVYEIDVPKPKRKTPKQLANQKSCFIDLGVNNLCSITSDQTGVKPVLVNGRIVKSINQWFNKKPNKQRSQKRYWRLENYFHHVSKYIIQFCQENNLTRIIIGRNEGWKQKTRMRRKSKTHQNFQSIPFAKLIQKIQYKAQLAGIEVVFTEEAYTSLASFFDGDAIPEYDKETPAPVCTGNRVKRGLYRTNSNALNADVNASLNIGRKVIGDTLIERVNRSVAATPERVNPLRIFSN